VKPQHLARSGRQIRDCGQRQSRHQHRRGVRLANLSKWLKGHTRLVRAMPNTPADDRRRGYRPLPVLEGVTREDREQTETVLGAVGATVWITDESQMDAVDRDLRSALPTCSLHRGWSRTPRGSWDSRCRSPHQHSCPVDKPRPHHHRDAPAKPQPCPTEARRSAVLPDQHCSTQTVVCTTATEKGNEPRT